MKISKNEVLENDEFDDNENIQLDINEPIHVEQSVKPKRAYKKKTIVVDSDVVSDIPVPVEKELKEKKPRTQAQIDAWNKAVEKRNENREKRKAEKAFEDEEKKKIWKTRLF